MKMIVETNLVDSFDGYYRFNKIIVLQIKTI